MTQRRRIVLNILATYGRSIFALMCGLFTSRWILISLGQTDFGLYGLIGGLTIFITFLNNIMAGATSRFYAFSVGAAKRAEDAQTALEDCRAWFNTALMIHTVLPLLLVCIGYPLVHKIVVDWLTIPADRVASCIWVLRIALVTCFIAMVEVPYRAMYVAKQYIAELTIYSFIQTCCTFFFAWYMISTPGTWLVRYALAACLIKIIPQVVICLRARAKFPECSLNLAYWGDWHRVRTMWAYAGWQAFAGVGSICRGQGIAILVNKSFGPRFNASLSMANQVSAHTQTLTSAMIGAFHPAITNACGAKNYKWMRDMSFRACKFGVFLVLIFSIPLALELKEVLHLWLKEPPPYTLPLCLSMIGVLVIDKSSIGHMLAVNANGKVALYQGFLGTALILTLPVAWIMIKMNLGVVSVGYAYLVMTAMSAWGRVYFARKLVGMSVRYWIFRIALPLFVIIVCSTLAGAAARLVMDQCLMRIALTTCFVELILLPSAWFLLLSTEERKIVVDLVRSRLRCSRG